MAQQSFNYEEPLEVVQWKNIGLIVLKWMVMKERENDKKKKFQLSFASGGKTVVEHSSQSYDQWFESCHWH
jgi:hypothetical protein